jgi:hypothetical protein
MRERVHPNGDSIGSPSQNQDLSRIHGMMAFGKRNGYPSKVVDWTPEQVRAAYRHARGTRPSTGR